MILYLCIQIVIVMDYSEEKKLVEKYLGNNDFYKVSHVGSLNNMPYFQVLPCVMSDGHKIGPPRIFAVSNGKVRELEDYDSRLIYRELLFAKGLIK